MKKLDVKTMVTCAVLLSDFFHDFIYCTVKISFHQCMESEDWIYVCAGIFSGISIWSSGWCDCRRNCRLFGSNTVPDRRIFSRLYSYLRVDRRCIWTVASEKTDTAAYFNCSRNRTTDLRIADQYLLDFCFIWISVRSTSGYTIRTVPDHDSGGIYRYRNPEQITGTL